MPEVNENFQLSIKNELTDKMKILCNTDVPLRIQQLFNEATRIIFPHIRPQRVTVFFSRGDFPVRFSDEHAGVYIRNLIAFDLSKLETKHDDKIIAAFLEEFAHCLLGIDDEKEVGYKVSEIYPKVTFNGEIYRLRGN